jgi:hypothetical protein
MALGQSGKTWRYWDNKLLGVVGRLRWRLSRRGVGPGSDGTPMAVKVVMKQRPSGALGDRLLRREIDIRKRVADSGARCSCELSTRLMLVTPCS